MAKAIVLVFALGFAIFAIIFAIIKYTAFGVKAAYKTVNDPEPKKVVPENYEPSPHDNKKALELVEFISATLSIQLALTSYTRGSIAQQSKAADDYSVGYVFGFSDGSLQKSTMAHADDGTNAAVIAVVFLSIYGNDLGASLFRKALNLQGSENFDRGRSQGGQDAIAFMAQGSAKSPVGWSIHLNDAKEGSHN